VQQCLSLALPGWRLLPRGAVVSIRVWLSLNSLYYNTWGVHVRRAVMHGRESTPTNLTSRRWQSTQRISVFVRLLRTHQP
jgi:hypothetical protein